MPLLTLSTSDLFMLIGDTRDYALSSLALDRERVRARERPSEWLSYQSNIQQLNSAHCSIRYLRRRSGSLVGFSRVRGVTSAEGMRADKYRYYIQLCLFSLEAA
ncbi:hypothetical protein Tco_0180681 [Tanacetum coccineum]